MKIKKLSENVINRIAAGEVVEGPYSVVRELVDNALDAAATQITVELVGGGREKIIVRDNGSGMTEADALLAFERHATSKIESAEDLESLHTYGFRGEALAAVASVSKVRLISRTPSASLGVELHVDGGTIAKQNEIACGQGTTIAIHQLFYNTPARRKFLGSERGEVTKTKRWLRDISLANPGVRFELVSDGKKKLSLAPRGSIEERGKELFGRGGVGVTSDQEGIAVIGYLLHPEMSKASSTSMTLLVNDRVVSDRGLVHAVKQGFGGMLKQKEYPVGYMHITTPPDLVDVNVHPQKLEVRFWNSSRMFQFLYHAVRNAVTSFSGHEQISEVQKPKVTSPLVTSPTTTSGNAALQLQPSITQQEPELSFSMSQQNPLIPHTEREEFSYSSLRYIGMMMSCYLLCESEEKFVIVDMHAAHERVNYNLIYEKLESSSPMSEQLLVPLVVTFAEEEVVDEIMDLIDRMTPFGFDYRRTGECQIEVTAKPSWISIGKVSDVFQDIGENAFEDSEVYQQAVDKKLDAVAARLACHASIRSGDTMTRDEVYALFEALDEAESSGLCPHGRPVMKQFSKTEVEQLFGRL